MKKVIFPVVLAATAALTLSAPANAVDVPTIWSLLAAGERSAVLTVTGSNVTTSNNGSSWYFNSQSMGFVKDGFCIDQSNADGADAWMTCDDVIGFNQESAQTRLSWHTHLNDAIAPDILIDNGWRVGTVTNLGGMGLRAIYTADAKPAYYPSGPRPLVNSASMSGWTLCWIGTYSDENVSLNALSSEPECDGNYIMYAGYAADYEWIGPIPTDAPNNLAETGFNAAAPAGIAAAMLTGAAIIALRRRATS